MRMAWLAGCAGVAMMFCAGGTALAQTLPPGVTLPGGTSTSITLPDGTKVTTNITGATTMTITTTGGPNPPISVNITNFTASGNTIHYVGTSTAGGATGAFDCTVNTSTNSVTGSALCNQVFGGSSTTPPPTTGGGTVTPPPTSGGGTVTQGPGGTTVITLPDGTSVTVTPGQLNLIRNVEAEQFLLSLGAQHLAVENVQSFVAGRLQQLQAAGLAPGGISLGAADRGYRGLSAGEGAAKFNLWGDVAQTWLEDNRIGSGVDGDSQSLAIGGELATETYVVGAYASYSQTDLSGADADNQSDGFTGNVYGRFSLTPQVHLTAAAGMGSDDVSYTRTLSGLTSKGDTNRDLKYGVISLDGQFKLSDSMLLVPSAGVTYAKSETDAYIDSTGLPIGGVESDNTIGNLGATVFFNGGSFTPFVTLSGSYQFDDNLGLDRSYGNVGAGFVTSVGQSVNLLAGVNALIGKSGEHATSVNLTLQKGF